MSNISVNVVPPFYASSDLIIIRTVTPVHAGIGRAGSVVELPIQRDEYGYPCIYSSSLKGSLKSSLLHAFLVESKDYAKARDAVQALLGAEPEEGEAFESSIAVLDAYLLAMPVRSLKGVYAYVTSPLLLRRFYERLEMLKTAFRGNGEGVAQGSLEELLTLLGEVAKVEPSAGEAVCIGGKNECEDIKVKEMGDIVALVEEYLLGLRNLKESIGNISDEQADALIHFSKKLLKLDKPLLVIRDEDAKNIIDRSTLRFTRVRLERETKTVKSGGLWTEEYLPPKTLLHSMLLYKKPQLSSGFIGRIIGKGDIDEKAYLEALKQLGLLSENDASKIEGVSDVISKMERIAEAVRGKVKELIDNQLKGYIILGGHETIGKGIVRVEILGLTDMQEKSAGGSR